MQFQSDLICIVLILTIINVTMIIADEQRFFDDRFHISSSCDIGYELSDWSDCSNSLSNFLWNKYTWYDDQPMNICKLKCTRKLSGQIVKFRWVWNAKFECADQAPGIIGEARGFERRQGAMKQAVSRMIEQAISDGLLTPSDFKCDQSSNEEK